MLNVKFIRDNHEMVINRLKIKNFEAGEIIGKVIRLDDERKTNAGKSG